MNPVLATRIRHWTVFTLRLTLLFPLLAGLMITSAGFSPSVRTLEQFRAVLLAGEVDRVSSRVTASGELSSLVWSESPLVWHQVEGTIADSEGPYTPARLMTDVSRTFVPPALVRGEGGTSSSRGIFPDWPFDIPGGWWAAAPWALVFLAMLASTPRLANRWTWFWLFTVGQIGAILYLVLEPRPLWRGPGDGMIRAERTSGSRGCGYSILLAIVWMLVATGIGQLAELFAG